MVEISELLRVPVFADLPEDQIAWFLSQSEDLHLQPGDTYVRQMTRRKQCLWFLKENFRAGER